MAAGATAFVGLALVARLALPLGPERSGARFADTLDRLPRALRVRPVLNDYVYGGQLIFNGVRPFIDSRADLYGDGFIRRYQSIVRPDRTALRQALAEYRIAWTIFPATNPIVQMLDQQPGWRRWVEADGIVIHASEHAQEHAQEDAPAR
jgi:hypothetical protein